MLRIITLSVVILLVAMTAASQTLTLYRHTFGSAGGSLQGNPQGLLLTVGQPASGTGSTGTQTYSAGFWDWTDILTGVDDEEIPQKWNTELRQNFPNPFNPLTTVPYSVGSEGAVHVTLRIYDVRGGLVTTLVDDLKSPGNYEADWDGSNSHGEQVASGIYFTRLVAGSYNNTRKLVLLK
jgi:hypothetical protein